MPAAADRPLTARPRRVLVTRVGALLLAVAGLLVVATPASAHEERPALFPDGSGERPAYLGLDNPRHRVVCHPDSARRIDAMPASPLRARNLALLDECRYNSIQDAVDAISRRNTSVYVLPGVYTERKYANYEPSGYCAHLASASDDPLARAEYIGSLTQGPQADDARSGASPIAISYSDQVRCPHNLNLIALFGDRTLFDDSIHCNSRWCGTQIVGTGRRPGRRTHRQPVQQAQRDPGRPRRRRRTAQLHRAARGVQLGLRDGDRRVPDRPRRRARQRRVRHPRVRQ